ncbi:MAG: hypothetical protein A2252_01805 [Elusimicrobia bacterium RIFOXYA2_FULL_39_19]|nr:MAG: hypothetical protein A2252_01805 [Elusimicrobia bacterium RIFOXYA2_FULL_39_19]
MKILTKYIYKESIKSFLGGLFVFTFVLVLNNLFQLIDLLINKGAGILITLQLTFYLVLSMFSVTIPMSILFAILLTYGRLSEDNEIIALNSAGIHTLRFTFQPLVLAIILSILLTWLNQNVIPKMQSEFRSVYISVMKKQTSFKFEEKSFLKIGDYMIYINDINKKNNDLNRVIIYKINPDYMQIAAKSGTAQINSDKIVFNLRDGTIQTNPTKAPEKITHITFSDYVMTIPFYEEVKLDVTNKSRREFTGEELREEMRINADNKFILRLLEAEYYSRWVIGSAVFCLVLVGLPIGIIFHRGGRTVGFGISIGIIIFYYFLLIGCITLTEKLVFIPVKYIMWFPNAVTFIIGLMFMKRLLRK